MQGSWRAGQLEGRTAAEKDSWRAGQLEGRTAGGQDSCTAEHIVSQVYGGDKMDWRGECFLMAGVLGFALVAGGGWSVPCG